MAGSKTVPCTVRRHCASRSTLDSSRNESVGEDVVISLALLNLAGVVSLSRRDFLKVASTRGTLLVVAISWEEGPPGEGTQGATAFTPNQWLTIDTTGAVTLMAHKSEMGQGVSTALPMILADELGADWRQVRVDHAVPGPLFQNMGTSGSGSVSGSWLPLRRAAAAARAMLVTAAATSWRVAETECTTAHGAVLHRLTGRRLGFGELVARAAQLPVPEDPPLRDRAEFTLVGHRVPDPAQPAIARGAMVYGLDVQRPGMLYAVVARCPVHGGRVASFDAASALAIPGVRQAIPIRTGVAIVATTTWAAMKGRDALRVQWDEGRNSSLGTADTWRLLEEALARGGKVARANGDARTVIAGSRRTMEAMYRWPWNAHAAMEPLNAVADVRDGACEIWAGTQSPNRVQTNAAALLGIAPDRVVVHVMRLGGGFGRRIADDYVQEAVEVSRAMATPVQVVWTREDDFQHDMYNPAQLNSMAAALGDDGLPVAWAHRVGDFHLSMFGPYDSNFDPVASGDPWGGIDAPYVFPNTHVELAIAESPIPTGAWRAVTYPAAVIARECFLDEIAHATGRDPLDLRMALIPSPGTTRRGSLTLDNGDRLRRVLSLAAERAGWGRRPSGIPESRRWGRGIACNPYHQTTMVAQVADVSVGAAGDVVVHRVVCAVDCGLVVNRSGVEKQFDGGVMWALSALLGNAVEFERGRTRGGTFGDYPVIRMREAPLVEVHVVESGDRPFGLGEPSVPAVAPAVLNAIFAATGKRIREVPIRAADLALSR
jgi:isoquinoline 1-oxidoreductase beta subunit